MKKKIFGLLTFMALAVVSFGVVSCSDDDSNGAAAASSKSMTFQVLGPQSAATRGQSVSTTNYLNFLKDFKVWAYFPTNNNYYVGTIGDGGILVNGDGKGTWTLASSANDAYWPTTGELNFYALTPAANANYAFDGSSLTYTVPADNSKQVDVMFANTDKQTSTTNAGVVPLAFKHALSQIRFTGATTSSRLSVVIKSITINNVVNSATFDLTKGTGITKLGTGRDNFGIGLSKNTLLSYSASGKTTSLTDNAGELLLIPQTLTPWATTKESPVATTAADAAGNSYLTIECQIYWTNDEGEKVYLVGSDTEFGKTYAPFDSKNADGDAWKAGNLYTYNLKFGSGYKQDGTVTLTPITYTVTTSDWNNVATIDTKISSQD